LLLLERFWSTTLLGPSVTLLSVPLLWTQICVVHHQRWKCRGVHPRRVCARPFRLFWGWQDQCLTIYPKRYLNQLQGLRFSEVCSNSVLGPLVRGVLDVWWLPSVLAIGGQFIYVPVRRLCELTQWRKGPLRMCGEITKSRISTVNPTRCGRITTSSHHITWQLSDVTTDYVTPPSLHPIFTFLNFITSHSMLLSRGILQGIQVNVSGLKPKNFPSGRLFWSFFCFSSFDISENEWGFVLPFVVRLARITEDHTDFRTLISLFASENSPNLSQLVVRPCSFVCAAIHYCHERTCVGRFQILARDFLTLMVIRTSFTPLRT
jgi:hypothetical protein